MIDIYGLIDPRTQRIKYIGQSIDCNQRLLQHLADTSNTSKVKWIAELKAIEMIPSVVVLDSAESRGDANYKENWWIIFARKQGWSLVNGTNPGDHRANFSDMFSAALQSMYRNHENSVEELNNNYVSERVSNERATVAKKATESMAWVYTLLSFVVAAVVLYWVLAGQSHDLDFFVGGMIWTLIFASVFILVAVNCLERWAK